MRRLLFTLVLACASHAWGQAQHDPAVAIAAQREALKVFAAMDGVWRGSAWTLLPSGEKRVITQTERIGPFLDGSVKVIEGRGYLPDGRVGFNAFGIISYNPATRVYSLRSYAMGHAGDFVIKPTADGYEWEIPMGPAKARYTASITNNTLREVGDRIVPDKEPVRFFEMTLTRVGDTGWPGGDPVPMK